MSSGTLDNGTSDHTELRDMIFRHEQDHAGPNAPLLASADSSLDSLGEDEIPTSGLKYSGGSFIWILTVSAGISGLLFGYEYASLFCRETVMTKTPVKSQHRRYFLHPRDHWFRSLPSTTDNT